MAASAARPAVEWVLKELVDRARPDIDRLVPGKGPSFSSGHVMAAIAIWGLLPPVVALVSGRHRARWWSETVIAAVAFRRVFLGVHWLTDVIGALLLGACTCWAVEWHHRRQPCAPSTTPSTPPTRRRPRPNLVTGPTDQDRRRDEGRLAMTRRGFVPFCS